jgi:CPA1 family monovalent cation:H+ antiporter
MSYAEIAGGARAVTRVRRNVVWDTLQFAANGAIFVLLGEQFPRISEGAARVVRETGHHDAWWLVVYVILITVGLAVLRFAWVYTSLRLTLYTKRKKAEVAVSRKTLLRIVSVFSIGGVRGAITLAGILTLPLLMNDGTPFPARDLAIFLASGVIVLSLLCATILLPRLVHGLKLPDDKHDPAEEITRVAAATAAIHAVEKSLHDLSEGRSDADLYAGAAARVMGIYRLRLEESAKTGAEKAQHRKVGTIEKRLRLIGITAEREEIYRLARQRHITDELARKLVRELDLTETRDGESTS